MLEKVPLVAEDQKEKQVLHDDLGLCWMAQMEKEKPYCPLTYLEEHWMQHLVVKLQDEDPGEEPLLEPIVPCCLNLKMLLAIQKGSLEGSMAGQVVV